MIVALGVALREELNQGRKLGPRTVIVVSSAALMEELNRKLGPPDFRVVAYKPLSAILSGEFPRDERYLFVIEAAETASLLTAQIAQLKQQYPISRIVLLGCRTGNQLKFRLRSKPAQTHIFAIQLSLPNYSRQLSRSHDELGKTCLLLLPTVNVPFGYSINREDTNAAFPLARSLF